MSDEERRETEQAGRVKDAPGTDSLLVDLPPEFDAVLHPATGGAARETGSHVEQYANSMLQSLKRDGAVVPELAVTARQLLKLVVTRHRSNPEASAAWLRIPAHAER